MHDGALLVEAPMPERGEMLDRYVVIRQIGRGGMGTVLEAFDPTLDRHVALKVLHRSVDEFHTARLLQEARALAAVSHPHVVQIYEVGDVDGQAFIAMELVCGSTLREWMHADPRPGWRACVQVFIQAGEGLAAAHERGLVHRDFKPGNAILDHEGRVRVLDFGLARRDDEVSQHTQPGSISPRDAETHRALTRTGAVVGTPAYMPLEQLRGQQVGPSSDQFSFCVALYEALYGERPYEGDSMAALVLSMSTSAFRPPPKGPRVSRVPRFLRQIVLRGLAADPSERWPSMDALLAELRRAASPGPRRWLVAGAATSGALVLGLGLAGPAKPEPRCTGARADLRSVWDDERRHGLRDVVLGTELPYAADTWTTVEAGLDAYAEGWVASTTRTCEATRVTEEQTEEVMTLRMTCLSTRRRALRTVVSVLERLDGSTLRRAQDVVEGLPGLDRCDDVEALRADVSSPEEPTTAAAVADERERLVEAKALSTIGNYAAAEHLADDVLTRAEALEYPPLKADALLHRGNARDSLGRFDAAEQDLRRAFLIALEHDHVRAQRWAAVLLTFLVGYERKQTAHGHHWGAIALALTRHPDTELNIRARALTFVGHLLDVEGKQDEALEHYERALELRRAGGDRWTATVLNDIGIVMMQQGRFTEAESRFREALSIYEQLLGNRHPMVGYAHNSLGDASAAQGQDDVALEHFERALALWEASLPPEHPSLVLPLGNIGLVYRRRGDHQRALDTFERALEISRSAHGDEHHEVAQLLADVGRILLVLGREDEGRARLDEALDLEVRLRGSEHPRVALVLTYVADARLQTDPGAALKDHQRALKIREEALGHGHYRTISSHRDISDVLRRLGRLDEAEETVRRGLARSERMPELHVPLVVELHARAARLAFERESIDAAREHAETAVALAESNEIQTLDAARARFVLASILGEEPGRRSDARALAEQARGAVDNTSDGESLALCGQIDAWLTEHP